MLKRVKIVDQVGCFESNHSAGLPFERLTFIFGENSYGKSTLCDIIRSLRDKDPSLVQARKTLPNDPTKAQLIELSFVPPSATVETTVKFADGVWSASPPVPLTAFVFDTEFIHRNVFTGLSIERRNHEAITQFVLGEQGVAKAESIADARSSLRATKKELKELKDTAFKGIPDLEQFVALEVTSNEDSIVAEIKKIDHVAQATQTLAATIEIARNRREPGILGSLPPFASTAEALNAVFSSSFAQAHEAARATVESHLRAHTVSDRTSKDWLQRGLSLMISDHCPYCGQILGPDALTLLEAYRNCFDEEFSRQIRDTGVSLDRLLGLLKNQIDRDLPERLESNLRVLIQFDELKSDAGFASAVAKLQASTQDLRKVLDDFGRTFSSTLEEAAIRAGEKRAAPYLPCSLVDFSLALEVHAAAERCINGYNRDLQSCLDLIHAFKATLSPAQIGKRLADLEAARKDWSTQIRRLQLADACKRLVDLQSAEAATTASIGALESELEAEQAAFLSQYFCEINRLLGRLGSGTFTISQQLGGQGNLPVIQLTANFRGIPLAPHALKACFSESDRRALALAVFLARATSLPASERENAMLFLDDPVTSFDDGRVLKAVTLMDELRAQFRQVVVFSHYPRFLQVFFERANLGDGGVATLKVLRTASGSKLEPMLPAEILDTEYHRRFQNIKAFAERQHQNDVVQDLRIFLESEVRSRYRLQIATVQGERKPFAEVIDDLCTCGAVDDVCQARLHGLRTTLNLDHHQWNSLTLTERVDLAGDVLKFVFESL